MNSVNHSVTSMESNFHFNSNNIRRLLEVLRKSEHFGPLHMATLYVDEEHDRLIRNVQNKLERGCYHSDTELSQDLGDMVFTKDRNKQRRMKILLREAGIPGTEGYCWYLAIITDPLTAASSVVFLSAHSFVISDSEKKIFKAIINLIRRRKNNNLIDEPKFLSYYPSSQDSNVSQEELMFHYVKQICSNSWSMEPQLLEQIRYPNKDEMELNRKTALSLLRQEGRIYNRRGRKRKNIPDCASHVNSSHDSTFTNLNPNQTYLMDLSEDLPMKILGRALLSNIQPYLSLEAKLNLRHNDLKRLCFNALSSEAPDTRERFLMLYTEDSMTKFQRIINRLSFTALEKICEQERVILTRDEIITKLTSDISNLQSENMSLRMENQHYLRYREKKRASRHRTNVNSWSQAQPLLSSTMANENSEKTSHRSQVLNPEQNDKEERNNINQT